MEIITLIFSFLFGVVIGSFLNVLILRKGTGLGLSGRSMCFSCGKTLGFIELIPIFSFLAQGGKCKKCGSKISIQYPLVELVSGLIVMGMSYLWLINFDFSSYAWGAFVLKTSAILALLSLSVYDLKHKIIPDSFSAWFSLSALIAIFWDFYFKQGIGSDIVNSHIPNTPVWFVLTGVSFFLIFAFVWVISKGKWIGFGDAKLVLGIGFLLGPIEGVSALILAFWAGALYGIFHLLVSHIRSKMNKGKLSHEIPFAPFLAIGTIVAVIYHVDLLSLAPILALFYV